MESTRQHLGRLQFAYRQGGEQVERIRCGRTVDRTIATRRRLRAPCRSSDG